MASGYLGKHLFVDLTNKKITEEYFDDETARNYLGGYGMGAKILYERQKKGIDPFGEENYIGILAGPLTGTSLPFVSRYVVVSKSPLTNVWGDANGSGFFGPGLKLSGHDGIFLHGVSEKPVYLSVKNNTSAICDASDLWGKDTYATEDILKARHGRKAEVACIGPGGEKLSRLAGVISAKGRAAARSGLGAVMGAKRVKAIVVLGENEVKVADPGLVETLRKKYTKQMRDGIGYDGWRFTREELVW
jgi:aldehyde:ferredoxin oxidoreductase